MSSPRGEAAVLVNGHSSKEDVKRVDKFNAAVRIINHLPKEGPFQPSNDLKLRFYAFYKAATEGVCNESKPAFWDVVKRAKWDAWKGVGNISKEEAMDGYIEALQGIIETMSFDDNIQEFMELMGPFYEFVHVNGQSVTVSPQVSKRPAETNGTAIATNGVSSGVKKPIPNGSARKDEKSGIDPENGIIDQSPDLQTPPPSETNPGMGAISEEDETFADATDSFAVQEVHSDDKSSSSNSPPRGKGKSRDRRRHSSKNERRKKTSSGQTVGSLLKDLEEYDEIVEPGNCEDALDAAVKAVERLHRDRLGRGVGELRSPNGRTGRGREEDSRNGEGPPTQANSNLSTHPGVSDSGLIVGESRARRSHGESGSGSESSGDSLDLGWDPHVAVVLFRMHRELQGITRQLDAMEGVMISQQRLLQTLVTQQAEVSSEMTE